MKKLVLIVLAILVTLIVVLVGLLPTLLSLSTVRQSIVASIDAGTEAEISVGSWSLRWFSGMEIRDLQVRNGEAFTLSVEGITTTRGIAGLVGDRPTLGTVVVRAPSVRMRQPTPSETSKPRRDEKDDEESKRSPAPERDEPAPVVKEQASFDFDLTGEVRVEQASFVLVSEDDRELLVIENADGSLTMNGSRAPVELAFETDVGGVEDAIRLHGMIVPPVPGGSTPWSANLVAELNTFPMGSFSAFVEPTLKWEGAVDGTVTSRISEAGTLEVQGAIRTPDLVVAGDRLNGDRLELGGSSINLRIVPDGKEQTLFQVELELPFGKQTIEGLIDLKNPWPPQQITIGLGADLAELARQLPRTLRIKEGVEIVSGFAVAALDSAVDTRIVRCGTGSIYQVSLVIQDLKAAIDNRTIALDEPIEIRGHATPMPNGLYAGDLKISSSFIQGSVWASVDGIEAGFECNLEKAMSEWRKFAEPPFDLAGNLELELHADSMTNVVSYAAGSMTLTDLQVGTNASLRFDRVVAKLDADFMPAGSNGYSVVAFEPKINVVCDGLDLNFRAGELRVDESGNPFVSAFRFDAGGSLGGVLALIPGAEEIAKLVGAHGDMGILAKGHMGADGLHLELIKLETPYVVLEGDADVPDLENPVDMALELGGNIDLERLKPALVAFAGFPGDVDLNGAGAMNLQVLRSAEGDRIKLDFEIEKLKFRAPGKPAFTDPRVSAGLTLAIKDGDLVLEAFDVTSTPVDLTGRGSYSDPEGRKLLKMDGKIQVDFAALAKAVAPFTDVELDIAGNEERAFKLDTSLAGKTGIEILRETTANAGLYVERLELFGVRVGELDVPLVISNGHASVRIATTVNNGQVELAPIVDVSGEKAELRLPPESTVLKDVKLDNAIASDLLAKMHPIFRGLTVLGGRIDLRMDSLRVPLDAAARPNSEIRGELRLKGVRLLAADLLETILTMSGETNLLVRAAEDPIVIENRNGRLHSEGLILMVGDYPVSFSGSVGFDQTLDYYVELPVTRRMVGSDVFQYLQNESIRVPIRGTAERPRLGRREYRDALNDLIKKAGKNLIKEKVGGLIEKEGGKILKDILRGL